MFSSSFSFLPGHMRGWLRKIWHVPMKLSVSYETVDCPTARLWQLLGVSSFAEGFIAISIRKSMIIATRFQPGVDANARMLAAWKLPNLIVINNRNHLRSYLRSAAASLRLLFEQLLALLPSSLLLRADCDRPTSRPGARIVRQAPARPTPLRK